MPLLPRMDLPKHLLLLLCWFSIHLLCLKLQSLLYRESTRTLCKGLLVVDKPLLPLISQRQVSSDLHTPHLHHSILGSLIQGRLIICLDLTTRKTFGRNREERGLYVFIEERRVSRFAVATTSLEIAHLWHRRLGQLPLPHLHLLFPNLFSYSEYNDFMCEVCQFSKHC